MDSSSSHYCVYAQPVSQESMIFDNQGLQLESANMPVVLECRNLVHQFDGLRALDHLSLEIEGSRVTAIIGPNGAGKTTLFHVLSGLLNPDRGEVRFMNQRIDRMPP